jgi:hypothetical protein
MSQLVAPSIRRMASSSALRERFQPPTLPYTPSDWRQLEFPSPNGGCLATRFGGKKFGGMGVDGVLSYPATEVTVTP